MKKLYIYSILFIMSFVVILNCISCSVSHMPLQVLVPAEISIKKQIKHVGIVNRSLPAKRKRLVNILEGFISGESILADRIGSEHCLRGLAEHLNNAPRFSAVIIEGERLKGTGTRSFPPPLSWSRVNEICQKYRVDALIALETFDSDINIRISKKFVKKKVKSEKTGEKRKVKVPRYHANLYINVNSGWKIYDPLARAVIDADVYHDRKSWRTRGDNEKEARRRLPLKRDAINLAGFNSGIQYGARISPSWIDVNRPYYIKGCPEFTEAYRYIRADDWESAVSIWEKILDNPNQKLAGRAAYNIAVAGEVRGDLAEAYEWAKRSYTEYGNKKGGRYMRIIQTRMEDNRHLKEQLD
jgi:hypothetical protein